MPLRRREYRFSWGTQASVQIAHQLEELEDALNEEMLRADEAEDRVLELEEELRRAQDARNEEVGKLEEEIFEQKYRVKQADERVQELEEELERVQETVRSLQEELEATRR